MEDDEDKFVFLTTWFDNYAKISREFFLIYFLKDNSIELYDRNQKRIFLKRTPCDTVEEKDFYVGSSVNVFSRKLKIVECLNEESNVKLERNSERTIIMLRSDAKWLLGRILDGVSKLNLLVVKLGDVFMTSVCVDILRTYLEKEWRNLNEHLSEKVLLIEVLGSDSVRKISKMLKHVSEESDYEHGILFQTSSVKYMSKVEIHSFDLKAVTVFRNYNGSNYNCCIIKPHAIKEGLAGRIVQDIIEAGFEIARIQMVPINAQIQEGSVALELLDLDYDQSESFFEVYKGVVLEYQGMVAQLASGPFLAMAICSKSDQSFRDFVGPVNPEIGKQIKPNCLRAKYGKDIVRNAVHCTDLEEDGLLEVGFFFSTSTNGE